MDGLRAVVTGASSGIGRAIAEACAAEGAEVLLTHRASPERAHAVAEAIAARGGRAHVCQADLATRDGCERLVAEARERLGRLDVWINNAGADVLTGEAAEWEWERKLDTLLAVDLKGTIACSYAAGEVMRGQERGGTIVNMSWDHVATGMAGENPQLFAAVKGGVLAFSKSLARALAPDGARQRPVPGLDRDRASASRPIASFTARSRRTRRWDAGAARRTWRARRSTSPRPKPHSSPARRSTSTAG